MHCVLHNRKSLVSVCRTQKNHFHRTVWNVRRILPNAFWVCRDNATSSLFTLCTQTISSTSFLVVDQQHLAVCGFCDTIAWPFVGLAALLVSRREQTNLKAAR